MHQQTLTDTTPQAEDASSSDETTARTFLAGHPVRTFKNGRRTAAIVCINCGHWHLLKDGVKAYFANAPCDPDGDHTKHYSVQRRIDFGN